jgi:condensin complex subunit 3
MDFSNANNKGKAPAADESIQLDLAADVLKGLLDKKNKFDSWCRSII